jgi:Amt family ammonium transporter
VALTLMYAVNAFGLLRISEEGEREGLDLHEHGISAYPEYVISSVSSPAAMTISREVAATAAIPSHIKLGEATR